MIAPSDYLTERGQAYFRQLFEIIQKNKSCLMPEDSYMLSMLANSLDMYQEALLSIREHGYVQTSDKTGWTQTNGYYAALKGAEERIIILSKKFGLSLSDRARLIKEMPAMGTSKGLDVLDRIRNSGKDKKKEVIKKKQDPMNPLTWGNHKEEDLDEFQRL